VAISQRRRDLEGLIFKDIRDSKDIRDIKGSRYLRDSRDLKDRKDLMILEVLEVLLEETRAVLLHRLPVDHPPNVSAQWKSPTHLPTSPPLFDPLVGSYVMAR